MNTSTNIRARVAGKDLAPLFAPKSIAIIGASADPAKFSGRFVPYLKRHNYAGAIYPINARRDEIAGERCYPDLASVPGDVDCVIYAAAASDAPQALAPCADKHVKLIVMTSAGFAERGDDEGRQAEAALVRLARDAGARVLGPNCVGFLNCVDSVAGAAAAAFEHEPPFPRGRIGVASQSGGIAMASIIIGGWSEGIGFSHVLSTGNEADLDIADAGRFLLEDENTDAICLTIEAVRDGDAFVDFLRDAQRAGKPVVVLKTGRSDLGQQMAASHTGALAGSHEVFTAAVQHYGVTLVDDLDELWQVAQMFAKLRASGKLLPRDGLFAGEGCAACSVSGGHIGLLADIASHAGMRFPALAEATQERLRTALGKTGAILNPVDMSGGSVADHGTWARTLAPLLDDPGVTVGLPIMTAAKNYDIVSNDLQKLDAEHAKPIVVTWAGGTFQGEGKPLVQRSSLPVFWTPGRTARGLLALDAWQRSHALAKAASASRTLPAPHPLIVDAAKSGRTSLTERESKQVIADLGFPVTRESLARSADEAVQLAQRFGFPVVLKGEHPDIAHKTEAGVVRLNLNSESEVRGAYADLVDRMAKAVPGVPANGVLVAEMAGAGIEFVMGARRDPVFGPMVMFGLGGIFVEALKDARLAPASLDMPRAHAMLRGIRGAALLQGPRGRAPADLAQLAALLCRLGEFALANVDHVSDIDINPLVLLNRPGANLCALDALILLAPRTERT
ncbi:acetate--CoA ligase family protein [Ramlibacter sp.]|uniref:acetate--CoA ligase family protein n=1 Tax=Ramlibacter sp. TaxID=1917967 RepID=UPI003D10F73B